MEQGSIQRSSIICLNGHLTILCRRNSSRIGFFDVSFSGWPIKTAFGLFLPAAGYRNGTVSNVGSNGNYWSTTSASATNAYNVNFNSTNFYSANSNNRYNGNSVRLASVVVPALPLIQSFPMYALTKSQLLSDLEQAFRDAVKGKSSKPYVLRFERHLDENLCELCDELWNRTYKPRPSSCFIITHPKQREVFAAEFRDRIVHHLYYNYTYELFSRTFIQDSYSCLPGRGTHYGIDRLEMHIRQESLNWKVPCYVLKMDISGYFMHINRKILLSLCLDTFRTMAPRRILKRVPTCWNDRIDFGFLEYLTREIVLLDPSVSCRIVGSLSDWDGLPESKSIFHTPEGCGLPIGNLTSQLFSNVYLNVLDQWMKRQLRCCHYGRYVDDFYVVSCDRPWLESIEAQVDSFLRDNLGLSLQKSKTEIRDVRQGVQFLGAYLLPHRRYASKNTVRHIRECVCSLDPTDVVHYSAVVNSCLGVLSHYRSYNVRRSMQL